MKRVKISQEKKSRYYQDTDKNSRWTELMETKLVVTKTVDRQNQRRKNISDYVVPTREMEQVKIAKDKLVEMRLLVTKTVDRKNWQGQNYLPELKKIKVSKE